MTSPENPSQIPLTDLAGIEITPEEAALMALQLAQEEKAMALLSLFRVVPHCREEIEFATWALTRLPNLLTDLQRVRREFVAK